ncbi:MAG: putative sodium-dependent bicarbonate transporter, partial [uncultured Gemmatimonadetes bacterium]
GRPGARSAEPAVTRGAGVRAGDGGHPGAKRPEVSGRAVHGAVHLPAPGHRPEGRRRAGPHADGPDRGAGAGHPGAGRIHPPVVLRRRPPHRAPGGARRGGAGGPLRLGVGGHLHRGAVVPGRRARGVRGLSSHAGGPAGGAGHRGGAAAGPHARRGRPGKLGHGAPRGAGGPQRAAADGRPGDRRPFGRGGNGARGPLLRGALPGSARAVPAGDGDGGRPPVSRPAHRRRLSPGLRHRHAAAARNAGRGAGKPGGAVPGWLHGAGGDGGERVVHRRAGGGAHRPSRGQPGILPDGGAGHHLSLQPGGGHPRVLCHRAVDARGRRGM